MSIVVPAVGDDGTAAWADAVAAQLNTFSLIDSGTWTVTHSSQLSVAAARSFNITFNSTPIVLVTGTMTNAGGQDFVVGINPALVTTTGCTVYSRFASGASGSGTDTIQWIAIGS